jgi:GH25 family lysozyme M1 (1,4-beta-N-acetylmuramidase)/glucan-binding YG repeat protein
MKKKGYVYIGIALIVAVMIISFAAMVVFIGNNIAEKASGSKETEAFSDTKKTDKNQDKNKKYDIPDLDHINIKYLTEDQVDLEVEDTAVNEVEYESTYVDTTDLLPSVLNQRETVDKKHVIKDNFPKSSATDKILVADLKSSDASGKTRECTVAVPGEINLYNTDDSKSNSYDISAVIKGDQSIIKDIGWAVKDSSVMSVSKERGNSTTVSRNSNFTGQLQINVVIKYYSSSDTMASEDFDINVNIRSMDDNGTRLYDKNGVALYLDKAGTKEAFLKDYDKQDAFYGAVKTTGWQTIDGKRYYFNADGWPVSGTQIIGGAQFIFDGEGVLVSDSGNKGIDVSRYQKEIDWKQVAASGISFAIIRCGFRGAVGAQLVEDSTFERNIQGAKDAGIKVGVYFFSQAVNAKEGAEEAAMVLKLCKGYTLDMPVYIDSENAINGRANDISKEDRTAALKAFCDTISSNGLGAGVYASKSWYYHQVNASELEKYNIWVAQYNTECNYTGKKDYWQFSSKGQVNGIEGNVDMDIKY